MADHVASRQCDRPDLAAAAAVDVAASGLVRQPSPFPLFVQTSCPTAQQMLLKMLLAGTNLPGCPSTWFFK